MNFKMTLGQCALASVLFGCSSTPVMNATEREKYLAQFVGQSSSYIQSHLDLAKLGYQNATAPFVQQNTLSYTVIRPISIPIPMAQNPALGAGAGTAVPIPTQSYDASLQCEIRFQLQNQIATAVQLSGRTC